NGRLDESTSGEPIRNSKFEIGRTVFIWIEESRHEEVFRQSLRFGYCVNDCCSSLRPTTNRYVRSCEETRGACAQAGYQRGLDRRWCGTEKGTGTYDDSVGTKVFRCGKAVAGTTSPTDREDKRSSRDVRSSWFSAQHSLRNPKRCV